jgi:hypothetical protein
MALVDGEGEGEGAVMHEYYCFDSMLRPFLKG